MSASQPWVLSASCVAGLFFATAGSAQSSPAPVLVELFTSEGCSSCPPADALLRQVNGTTVRGRPVIGIGEHVTYWNGLGWTDRFSSRSYTARQEGYGQRFGLDSVYTPQMVVDGRTQFVGSDRGALERAIDGEARDKQVAVNVSAAAIVDGSLVLDYRVDGTDAVNGADIVALLTDDVDRTEVARGENGGRTLVHAAVARLMMHVGTVRGLTQQHVTVPMPAEALAGPGARHVVVFVQGRGFGPVVGVGSRAL